MKICFVAPSGYGKTTAVKILSNHYNTVNVKIGKPLYDLQDYFYEKIKAKLQGEQDGELLQFYGMKVRKENPSFLIEDFKRRLDEVSQDTEIITNDDCRPNDYDYLKNLDFIFIKIDGYRRDRIDHSSSNPNLKLEWQSEIPFDYILPNLTNIIDYEQEILKLIEEVKNDRKVLCYTSSKKV